MNWGTLFEIITLYLAHKQNENDTSHAPENVISSPVASTVLPIGWDILPPSTSVDEQKGNQDSGRSIEVNSIPPYDCSMPIQTTEDIAATEQNKEKSSETSHDKASIQISLHIVHRLSDSEVADLFRFEHYCEEKINSVYTAIKELNDFYYQKMQEIQYLSYSDKRKEEINKQSNEKKDDIKLAYVKMHRVCDRAEDKRDKITKTLNPYLRCTREFYTQPKRVPKCWFDMHNLETIVMQLFTPKLTTKTYYDEEAHVLRMRPRSTLDMTPKRFIPLPDEYVSPVTLLPNGNDVEITVDGSSLNVEENHPNNAVQVLTEEKSKTNIFTRFIYSTDADIQRIIIHYEFKYWKYQVGFLTRKVSYYVEKLRKKKRSSYNRAKISALENKLADSVAEMQSAAREMERNRDDPEIINVYNAENAARELLPSIEYTTHIFGDKKDPRVATVFNPRDAIILKELAVSRKQNELNGENVEDEEPERVDLVPLEWDKNWSWDN